MQTQWQTIRQVLQYYPRVFRLLWESSPRYTLAILSLTVISSLATPAVL